MADFPNKRPKKAHALSEEERKELGILPYMCGVKTKSAGWCKGRKVTGRSTCRMHGGKTPIGPESPAWKTGATSVLAFLRPELREAAEQKRRDVNRLDLTNELALLSAAELEAVTDWASGGGGDAWIKLRTHADTYNAEVKRGKDADVQMMRSSIDSIMGLIYGNSARVDARDKMQVIIDNIRKVAETERRRSMSLRTMMATEEIMAILGRIGETIARVVPDQEMRRVIINTIQSSVIEGYKVNRPDVDADGHIIEASWQTGD